MNEQWATCWVGSRGKIASEFHQPEDNDIADSGYPRHAGPCQLYACCDARCESCPYALAINVKTEDVLFEQIFCLYGMRQNRSS